MKKILSIILTAVMLLTLSACGEKTSNDLDSQPKVISEDVSKADNTEELNNIVINDVDETISSLKSEFEKLCTEINTYAEYKNGIDKVEVFYEKIRNDTLFLCIRLREYSSAYAEMILSSDKSFDDKDDELDVIYDSVYEDARDEIYDEIYDGILDDIYDEFYDGILDDAYDHVPYKEWADARSDEFDLWSDTRSDVFDAWSDVGSDIYDFWSDLGGEMWDEDIEKAMERLQDFKGDIELLYGKSPTQEKTSIDLQNNGVTNAVASEQSVSNKKQWKEFLLEYEDWVDDYVAFLKKYKENPSDISLLTDYTKMMTELSEWSEKTENMQDELSEVSPAEVAEYSAELMRIAAKLAGAGV